MNTFQQDIRDALRSMESTTGDLTAGAGVADQAGRTLEEIERSGRKLLASIESLATAATGESDAANRVSGNMDDLRRAAEQSGPGVSQVAAALGKIRGHWRHSTGPWQSSGFPTESAALTAIPAHPRSHPRLRNPLQ